MYSDFSNASDGDHVRRDDLNSSREAAEVFFVCVRESTSKICCTLL